MKKFVSLSLSLLVVFVTLIGGMPGKVSANENFSDIGSDYPYRAQINYLVDRGIINGYLDNTFRPENEVTRREAAVMIGRVKNLNGTQRSTSFSDVKASDYASGYIQSAAEAGYITGYNDGTYRPNAEMTRGEMAYLLSRVFDLATNENYYFSDVNPYSNVYDPINEITAHGMSAGYPDNTFRPARDMTRTEFSIFVARAMEPTFRVTKAENAVIDRVVVANSLNVRTSPSVDNNWIGALPYGTLVHIIFRNGDWAYVKTNTVEGYVHTDYLAVPVTNIADAKITVDAGHGGSDPGALGNGLVEKEVTLAVSKLLQDYLEGAGVEVVMTRTGDTYPTLSERVDIAQNSGSNMFLSIHANKFSDEGASGTETYFNTTAPQGDEGKILAGFIQNRLYKALDTENRGIKFGDFHVIRENPLPGVLVELGFLSNPEDARKLASDYYRDKAAEAIYLGIVDYYKSKN